MNTRSSNFICGMEEMHMWCVYLSWDVLLCVHVVCLFVRWYFPMCTCLIEYAWTKMLIQFEILYRRRLCPSYSVYTLLGNRVLPHWGTAQKKHLYQNPYLPFLSFLRVGCVQICRQQRQSCWLCWHQPPGRSLKVGINIIWLFLLLDLIKLCTC